MTPPTAPGPSPTNGPSAPLSPSGAAYQVTAVGATSSPAPTALATVLYFPGCEPNKKVWRDCIGCRLRTATGRRSYCLICRPRKTAPSLPHVDAAPLRPYLARKNFSEMARRTGVSRRTFIRVAHGQTSKLRFDTADKIATGLGYHVANIWPEAYE